MKTVSMILLLLPWIFVIVAIVYQVKSSKKGFAWKEQNIATIFWAVAYAVTYILMIISRYCPI